MYCILIYKIHVFYIFNLYVYECVCIVFFVYRSFYSSAQKKTANGNLKWQKHCECNCDATHYTIINDINALLWIFYLIFSIRLFFHKLWTIFFIVVVVVVVTAASFCIFFFIFFFSVRFEFEWVHFKWQQCYEDMK